MFCGSVGKILISLYFIGDLINMNGVASEIFKPSRELRQGDPLISYLFLICSECLSTLMRLAKEERLRGIKICRRELEISHLMFAVDCIPFGEVSNRGAVVPKNILKEYEDCLGQCINFEKSLLFFSSNSSDYAKELVNQSLGVRCSIDPQKYLGLLNMVGREHFRIWRIEW